MTENEQLLQLASDLTRFDLPIGVYVVNTVGRFVKCNQRARETLHLPLEGEVEDSITSFYTDPTNREKMHEELLDAEARNLHLEKTIAFKVDGREMFVRDLTRSLQDKDGRVLGYVCCITDVTEGERSNRLVDTLPAGIYKLDANDRFETANRAFARILGYDSPEEIDGKPSSDFYVSQAEAVRLRQLVEGTHPEPVINFTQRCSRRMARTFSSISTPTW